MTNEKSIALSIGQACQATSIGRTALYQAIGSGQLRTRKLGKRTLILRDDLEAFLAALPSERERCGA